LGDGPTYSTGADVGVNFRRYDTRMTEQSLDDSQVGAVLQHVSCRAVPKRWKPGKMVCLLLLSRPHMQRMFLNRLVPSHPSFRWQDLCKL